MHFVDIVTILATGLLTGNELAVSLFFNPALWRLDDNRMASALARSLGKVMPLWYALCLILLAAVAFLHRAQDRSHLVIIAAAIWALIIVYTLVVLVPINTRIAAATAGESWVEESHRWDARHRWRIGLLLASLLCLLTGLNV